MSALTAVLKKHNVKTQGSPYNYKTWATKPKKHKIAETYFAVISIVRLSSLQTLKEHTSAKRLFQP